MRDETKRLKDLGETILSKMGFSGKIEVEEEHKEENLWPECDFLWLDTFALAVLDSCVVVCRKTGGGFSYEDLIDELASFEMPWADRGLEMFLKLWLDYSLQMAYNDATTGEEA